MTTTAGVVAVGASVATGALVAQLRADGYDAPITVIDSDPDAPYDRPPLSKGFLGADDHKPEAQWWTAECTIVRGTATALEADTSPPALRVVAPDGSETRVQGDHVVLATGSAPSRLAGLPEGVVHFRSAQDARRLRSQIRRGSRVVILGAGTVGTELASTVADAGGAVTLVELADRPLDRFLAGHLGSHVAGWIEEAGVRLLLRTRVAAVTGRPGDFVVETDTADALAADVVVSAVGNRPVTWWLDGAGLDIRDGVACSSDGHALTSDGEALDHIHAIGDVASWVTADGTTRRREDWTSAQRQGRVVAKSITGAADGQMDAELDYFWSQQFGRRIQVLGQPVRDAVIRTHREVPEQRSSFHTLEVDGVAVAWVAINSPRDFAMALHDQRRKEDSVPTA